VRYFVIGFKQASRPIVSAANTRMNAAIVPSAVQAPVGSIVMRPAQSNVVVGPPVSANVQPPMSVVGARIIGTSTAAASMPRRVVPANASIAGMFCCCKNVGNFCLPHSL